MTQRVAAQHGGRAGRRNRPDALRGADGAGNSGCLSMGDLTIRRLVAPEPASTGRHVAPWWPVRDVGRFPKPPCRGERTLGTKQSGPPRGMGLSRRQRALPLVADGLPSPPMFLQASRPDDETHPARIPKMATTSRPLERCVLFHDPRERGYGRRSQSMWLA
jgi:hypothetical protein